MSNLVLTRKVGEQIVIDDDIEITVIRSSKGRVRLAVSAPRHVRIIRAEIDQVTHNWQRGAAERQVGRG